MASKFYFDVDGFQRQTTSILKPNDHTFENHPLVKYFDVTPQYLGLDTHTGANLFCEVKEKIGSLPRQEMDNMFMEYLLKEEIVRSKDSRLLLEMMDAIALATHGLRSLYHYEWILRTLAWSAYAHPMLNKLFKKDKPSLPDRYYDPGAEWQNPVFKIDNMASNYAKPISAIVFLSCVHYYYITQWKELEDKYKVPIFEPHCISASKTICVTAKERYQNAIQKKKELAKIARSSASVSEVQSSFLRWREPVDEDNEYWECN